MTLQYTARVLRAQSGMRPKFSRARFHNCAKLINERARARANVQALCFCTKWAMNSDSNSESEISWWLASCPNLSEHTYTTHIITVGIETISERRSRRWRRLTNTNLYTGRACSCVPCRKERDHIVVAQSARICDGRVQIVYV